MPIDSTKDIHDVLILSSKILTFPLPEGIESLIHNTALDKSYLCRNEIFISENPTDCANSCNVSESKYHWCAVLKKNSSYLLAPNSNSIVLSLSV